MKIIISTINTGINTQAKIDIEGVDNVDNFNVFVEKIAKVVKEYNDEQNENA